VLRSGPPTPFDALNTDADEGDLRYSSDGALAFFTRGSFITGSNADIWVASKANGFLDASPLTSVNPPSTCCVDAFPSVSPDGNEIFFHTNDVPPGLPGAARVWRAYRDGPTLDFDHRAPIEALKNISAYYPLLNHDGSAVYFTDLTSKQLKRSARITGGTFAAPTVVLPEATFPAVSGDEQTLYFARSGVAYIATKNASDWVEGGVVPALNGFVPSWLSPDGCTITLLGGNQLANGKTGANIWTASKPKS
jgi:hypothetical protein